jgi:uncharacterized protein YecT (DUF1311 family)
MEIAMLRVAVLVCACIPSFAYACDEHCDPHSGLVMDASCLELAWQDPAVEKAESELSDAYEVALNTAVRKALLEKAQQAWNDYREANCELMSERDGQPAAEPQAQCLVFMTNERAAELRLLSR